MDGDGAEVAGWICPFARFACFVVVSLVRVAGAADVGMRGHAVTRARDLRRRQNGTARCHAGRVICDESEPYLGRGAR